MPPRQGTKREPDEQPCSTPLFVGLQEPTGRTGRRASPRDSIPTGDSDGGGAAFRELDRSRRIGWARAYAAERRAAAKGELDSGTSVTVSSTQAHGTVIIDVAGYVGEGERETVQLYLGQEEIFHLTEALLAHANRTRPASGRRQAPWATGWTTTLSWP